VDASLVALSSAAATTLVTSMTTDSWEQVKAALVEMWRRRHPEQAKDVAAELTAARSAVIAADRAAGEEETEADLLVEWRSRLRRLAASDKQFRDELERFTEEFRHLHSEPGRFGRVTMRAEVHGPGRVNQAGGNQTVISG
jgi:hypothetical protein